MRYLLAVATTLLLLGAAEPVADADPVPPRTTTEQPSGAGARTQPPPGVPFRLAPRAGEQCVLPVSASLLPCVPTPHREPTSCVVPVQAPGVRVPECPRTEELPEGRVVPLQSLTDE